MKAIMKLSQEEKDKLYELIDKLNPCVAMGSKETIERFKEYESDVSLSTGGCWLW